ncbi:MAG: peptidase [Gammaproteobacteria bacterium]|nr:MAG: peptidase [Gammaproteobacteria bacterium]
MKTVDFIQMKDGTKAEYEFLEELESDYASKVGERLMDMLADLENTLSGYRVSRLEHSLQSATRAYYDGADIDWIVTALLHDIGDVYAPYNHDEYAATVLAPYVREQCSWTVLVHGAFQMKYYAHHVGGDPNKRRHFADSPYFDDCDYFCEHWDQTSFDPDYPSKSLAFFRPMVLEVFRRKAKDPNVTHAGFRVPLHNEEIAAQRRIETHR